MSGLLTSGQSPVIYRIALLKASKALFMTMGNAPQSYFLSALIAWN